MSEREEELLARLESLNAVLEREAEESRRELDESQEERAEDARAGRLGPDWQRVQERIDSGRTTLADVFSGNDDSPEAARLVGTAQARFAELRADLPLEVETEIAAAETEQAALGIPLEPPVTPPAEPPHGGPSDPPDPSPDPSPDLPAGPIVPFHGPGSVQ